MCVLGFFTLCEIVSQNVKISENNKEYLQTSKILVDSQMLALKLGKPHSSLTARKRVQARNLELWHSSELKGNRKSPACPIFSYQRGES